MRAYRCDACHKIFLIPNDYYEDEENVRAPAGVIYIYQRKGVAISFDLCEKCLGKVVNEVEKISTENGAGGGGGFD